jgi:hypothetical protein
LYIQPLNHDDALPLLEDNNQFYSNPEKLVIFFGDKLFGVGKFYLIGNKFYDYTCPDKIFAIWN